MFLKQLRGRQDALPASLNRMFCKIGVSWWRSKYIILFCVDCGYEVSLSSGKHQVLNPVILFGTTRGSYTRLRGFNVPDLDLIPLQNSNFTSYLFTLLEFVCRWNSLQLLDAGRKQFLQWAAPYLYIASLVKAFHLRSVDWRSCPGATIKYFHMRQATGISNSLLRRVPLHLELFSHRVV